MLFIMASCAESVIADGPKERSPPDGVEMEETNISLADSGCHSINDVETDAVPRKEDVQQALEMRDQLGIPQDIPEKSTEEDKKELPDLINSPQQEPDLKNDTKNADSPNGKNQEQQQKKTSRLTVLPEERVARFGNGHQTQSSNQGARDNITDDSDASQAPIDDIGVAKVHISDQQANQKNSATSTASPNRHSRDIQDGTTTSQPNLQPAAPPKKPNIAAVFSSHEAQTAPRTPSQETNTLTSEHCSSQVYGSVPSVSQDIGEMTTMAQPDSSLNLGAASPSSQPSPLTAKEIVTSPHTPTQETNTFKAEHPPILSSASEEEYFDVLLIHSEHDMDHVNKFMEFAVRYSWKVTNPDEFLGNVYKSQAFNLALERSSFTVLLLTQNFLADVWCESRYQTALVQSIENLDKRFCVIPVTCEAGFKMPVELSVLTGVKIKSANCEKVLKKTIRVDKRIQRERAAASANQEILGVEAAALSLDELYIKRRPELNPGQHTSQIFPSDGTFRDICIHLDKEHPLGRDWRLVAEQMGFKSSIIEALKREKSPAAQILECFCQQKRAQGKSKQDILKSLRTLFSDIQRADIAGKLP